MRKRANAGTVNAVRLEEMAEHLLISLDEMAGRLGMAPRTLRALRAGEIGLTEERKETLRRVLGPVRLAYVLGETDEAPRRPLLVLGRSRLGRVSPLGWQSSERPGPPPRVPSRSTPRPRVDEETTPSGPKKVP